MIQIAGGIMLAVILLALLPRLISLTLWLVGWGLVLGVCVVGALLLQHWFAQGQPITFGSTAVGTILLMIPFGTALNYWNQRGAAATAAAQVQAQADAMQHAVEVEALIRARAQVHVDEMRARAAGARGTAAPAPPVIEGEWRRATTGSGLVDAAAVQRGAYARSRRLKK